ncbi:MAG: flavin reductase [Solirubrobacterales bacterium]|nr:flavin reductase [Solirubrobacterales bacterium]MBV9713981.1 flavin reductase [Solirubrobacterales bacterium]
MSATGETSFDELVSQLDYSMLIITAAAGGERSGCLIGFATQVSIDPPRFLACLSVKNRTYRVARSAEVLVVHFVTGHDGELAELFGGETGDEMDKFERCAWHPSAAGTPVLERLQNWFAGRIVGRHDFGDHWGFVLEPIEGEAGRSEETLTFQRAKAIEPGHEA